MTKNSQSDKPKTTGATRVANGQQFEDKTDLSQMFINEANKNDNLTVTEEHFSKHRPIKTQYNTYFEVKYNNQVLGYITKKKDYYNLLEEVLNIPYQNKIKPNINSQFEPDDVFINVQAQIIWIIEKKQQTSTGSVTEKLGTFPVKRRFYQQMILNYSSFSVQFIGLISEFLANVKESQDWINESRQSGVIFETEVNLAQFGIPA